MRIFIIKLFFITILLSLFSTSMEAAQCDNSQPEWIFCEDFESGTFSKWGFVWRDGQNSAETAEYGLDGQCITNGGVTSGVCPVSSWAHTGTKAFLDHYAMNSSGATHNDNNHTLSITTLNNLTHWFIRGYLYFPNNIKWCGNNNDTLQRKLIYFKGNNWDSNSNSFGFFLGSWTNSVCNGINISLGYGGHGGVGVTLWDLAPLVAGQWYAIEVEVQFSGTVGNDIFRLWVNNIIKAEYTNLTIRSQYDIDNSIGLTKIELGRQVDRYNSNSFDEYRFWDNIVVSSAFIGTITTFTEPSPPSYPTNLGN